LQNQIQEEWMLYYVGGAAKQREESSAKVVFLPFLMFIASFFSITK
jgi:hypothetical protein